jgi:hypothetical protein
MYGCSVYAVWEPEERLIPQVVEIDSSQKVVAQCDNEEPALFWSVTWDDCGNVVDGICAEQ